MRTATARTRVSLARDAIRAVEARACAVDARTATVAVRFARTLRARAAAPTIIALANAVDAPSAAGAVVHAESGGAVDAAEARATRASTCYWVAIPTARTTAAGTGVQAAVHPSTACSTRACAVDAAISVATARVRTGALAASESRETWIADASTPRAVSNQFARAVQ